MALTKVKSGGVSDSITLTSPDINAPDIDGGTIDNAVIGGSTAAAGSFTTITATGGSSSNWNTAYGWGDHSTQSYATQTYVGTEVSNLVDSSPAALDTLNELAAALGDDPNFATTVTNSIALKAPLASPSFTGTATMGGVEVSDTDDIRIRLLNGATFKAGIQVATTAGDMIAGSAVDDLAIRAQTNMLFATGGNTERMRIDSSGNLLVGASSASAKLTVGTFGDTARAAQFHGGSILIDGGAASEILIGDGNVAYMSIHTTDNATAMKIRNHSGNADLVTVERASGRVGIGQSSPTSPLHVKSGANNDNSIITIEGATNNIFELGYATAGAFLNSAAGDPMVFRINETERLRIDSDGATIYNGRELRVKRPNGSGDIRLFNTVSYATLESTVDPIYIKSANAIRFDTNGNDQRMLIDNSGRLGLGVTPEAWSSVFKVLRIGTGSSIAGESGGTSTWFNTNAYYDGSWKRINTNTSAQIAHTSDGKQEFKVAASGSAGGAISWNTAVTINNSGALLVGGSVEGPGAQSGIALSGQETDSNIYIRHASGTGSGSRYMAFTYNTSQLGSITQHGTSQILFNTTSDERAKENIVDAPSASDDIDAIQVRSFDWKADGEHQKYGMVAQELQTVAPEAVSAPENPDEMMGVDYSKLVPMLIKEIQSLRNRVAQLEA